MKSQHLDLKTPDGSCDTYMASPGDGKKYPGVLFFMDGFGPRDALHAMAQKIAAHGYVVLVPNVFYRVKRAPVVEANFPVRKDDMPDLMKQLQALLGGYDPEMGVRDAEVFLKYLAELPEVRPGKVGVTGYCMGGGLALRTAARYPERIAAAASFHGGRL